MSLNYNQDEIESIYKFIGPNYNPKENKHNLISLLNAYVSIENYIKNIYDIKDKFTVFFNQNPEITSIVYNICYDSYDNYYYLGDTHLIKNNKSLYDLGIYESTIDDLFDLFPYEILKKYHDNSGPFIVNHNELDLFYSFISPEKQKLFDAVNNFEINKIYEFCDPNIQMKKRKNNLKI